MISTSRILLALLLTAAAAIAQTTTISDTMLTASGNRPLTGKIVVYLNNPGAAQPLYSGTTALGGWREVLCLGVTGGDCTEELAAGVVEIELYTNDAIVPAGTSYSAQVSSTSGQKWNETWIVAAGHTKLREIRGGTVPTPDVMIAPSRITQAGAITGQAMVWNGSIWAPATIGAGTTYTASAVIDVIAVPDGSCVLDSTAVTITGAALGGRPTVGSSFQPPEGVNLEPKVTGPNSIKIEICNHSGALYNPASATYYFGVQP